MPLLMWLLVAGCQPPDGKDQPFQPVEGAVLSVAGQSEAGAARLMADVQAMLQAEPDLAKQALSHGAEPPAGYFFKFKGRCAAEPLVAKRVREKIASAGGTGVRCEDVAG
jgi:hypothetical protein